MSDVFGMDLHGFLNLNVGVILILLVAALLAGMWELRKGLMAVLDAMRAELSEMRLQWARFHESQLAESKALRTAWEISAQRLDGHDRRFEANEGDIRKLTELHLHDGPR